MFTISIILLVTFVAESSCAMLVRNLYAHDSLNNKVVKCSLCRQELPIGQTESVKRIKLHVNNGTVGPNVKLDIIMRLICLKNIIQ